MPRVDRCDNVVGSVLLMLLMCVGVAVAVAVAVNGCVAEEGFVSVNGREGSPGSPNSRVDPVLKLRESKSHER
jgi:hypothetical protein